MAATDKSVSQEVTEMVINIVNQLPAKALARLVRRPEALKNAVQQAAGVAAREHREGEVEHLGGSARQDAVSDADAVRHLDALTAPMRAERLLTSEEISRVLGVKSRQTVLNWQADGKLLGWQGAKRGMLFPAAQLDAANCPIPHLAVIRPHFPNDEALWDWLNVPMDELDGQAPMDALRANDIESVIALAVSYAQGDFG